MKVAVKLREPDRVWDKYLDILRKETDVALIYDDDLEGPYQDIELMITTHITEYQLSRFPILKRIFLFKTGMDGLPSEAIEKRNITVICSHANSDVISEHTLALALALLHRIPEFHNDLCKGKWRPETGEYRWNSISTLNIGILGFGCIGKCLYNKLLPLNNNITVLNHSGIYPNGIKYASSLNELVELNDIIFICVPKTRETTSLFNENIFNKMAGKFIVNTARAEICSEEALYNALSSGKLAGYAGDVWYKAPPKKNKSLICMPSSYPFEELSNVVMSPHNATHDFYSHEKYIRDAVETCIKFIKERQ